MSHKIHVNITVMNYDIIDMADQIVHCDLSLVNYDNIDEHLKIHIDPQS